MSTPRQLPLVTTSSLDPGPAAVPSRRQFCAHACQAASLIAVGAMLQGCGGGDDPASGPSSASGNTPLQVLNAAVAGRTVTVSVAASGPLGSVGGTALVNAGINPPAFLVFRSSQTTFSVLTAICTHEGCTVEQFNGELFVCPCHNSKYTTAGSVANGPATRALTSFPSTFGGDVLTFTV